MEKPRGPMEKTDRPSDPDQLFLLPPALPDGVPAGPLVHVVSDGVDELDLTPLLGPYEQETHGDPPSHPRLMTTLVLDA